MTYNVSNRTLSLYLLTHPRQEVARYTDDDVITNRKCFEDFIAESRLV